MRLASNNLRDITIIIPMYGDVPSLRRCIKSTKKYSKGVSVLLINDCGPEAEAVEHLVNSLVGNRSNYQYVRNKKNIGFIRTCNKAVFMLDTTENDILLLNSDAVLTRGAVSSMQKLLYREANIASVSPRSNYATVFSIPFAAATDNTFPAQESYRLFKKVKNRLPEAYETPTTHGFCMLIRREVIKHIGLFDTVYGRGYCEESDFCMRARHRGYKHLISNRAFVFHEGSKSFTVEVRNKIVDMNNKILLSRYPEYNDLVDRYVHKYVIPEQELLSC